MTCCSPLYNSEDVKEQSKSPHDLTRQEVFCSAHSSLLRLPAPPKLRHSRSEMWGDGTGPTRWLISHIGALNTTNNTRQHSPSLHILNVGCHDILMFYIWTYNTLTLQYSLNTRTFDHESKIKQLKYLTQTT